MTKWILVALAMAFVVLAVQGAAVPAELQVAGKAARSACIEETGTTEDKLEKAGKGEFADDDKFKCYFKCVFEKFTLIEDGDIKFDAMKELLPDALMEKGTKLIDTCRETSGSDLCEKSYNFNKCLYQENPEAYFVV